MTRPEMLEIMERLDARARALLIAGADDADLFVGMADDMPDFKALLDSPYRQEIETTGRSFPGFHRYAMTLSNMAKGIADGSIQVPR